MLNPPNTHRTPSTPHKTTHTVCRGPLKVARQSGGCVPAGSQELLLFSNAHGGLIWLLTGVLRGFMIEKKTL